MSVSVCTFKYSLKRDIMYIYKYMHIYTVNLFIFSVFIFYFLSNLLDLNILYIV